MSGLLILTHGDLATHLLRALEAIVGPVEQARAVTIAWDADQAETLESLRRAIGEVDQGEGVLIATDMFGGTATSLALTFLGDRIEIVTGVNLPMLVKFATLRHTCTLREAAEKVRDQGQRAITVATECLRAPAPGGRTNR